MEEVGLIGKNGVGQPMLLKVLSHITKPTRGRASLYGRVGSMLEVGTGFHPALTGRENIFLNGTIRGMKRAEIAREFEEIIEFSEVVQFLNTPVKHYSSGMRVRPAFAVTAHFDTDILMLDEVLAVGDEAVRQKCTQKLHTVARGRPHGSVCQPRHARRAGDMHTVHFPPRRPDRSGRIDRRGCCTVPSTRYSSARMMGNRRLALLDMQRDIVPISHSDAAIPTRASRAWDGSVVLFATQSGRNPII